MRIGILTFHCAHNYGAVLQCYALQEVLRQMGHEAEVIDYRPSYITAPYWRFNIHRIISRHPAQMVRKAIDELALLPGRFRRYRAFSPFISGRLALSPKVHGRDIPSGYDAYVFGSDQIWNPAISNGFDPVFFGEFSFPKGSRKYISYAASMEATELDEDKKAFYRSALRNFDAVSVREEELQKLLQPLTDKKVETVLDPTLLLDADKWAAIARKPAIGKDYVLVYQVRQNAMLDRIADRLAGARGCDKVELKAWLSRGHRKGVIQDASPEEFLGWIRHAGCVVTTSFHGTAFSIIFGRPFYYVRLGDGNDSRAMSLLRSCGLQDRIIDASAMSGTMARGGAEGLSSGADDFRCNEAAARLAQMKDASLDFLHRSLDI